MSLAIYVRVSTQRQTQAQTIEQQLERLRAYIQSQGWELTLEHIFRDDGYSGASLNRPGLDRLRDAVRAAEVDRVLITDPDRLARNYVHQMVLLEELERGGCQVLFLDRPMSQDPHDQLVLQIRGAVAEYERTLIAERMRRGRQMKLRAGSLLPWTRPPYGYRVDPDRPRDPAGVRVEPAEAAVIQDLFARYDEPSVSLFALARHLQSLGVVTPHGQSRWNPATIRGLLTNPAYTGHVYAGRFRSGAPQVRYSATRPIGRPFGSTKPLPPEEWIPVTTVPALIDPEQFARVQAKLAQNQSFARRNNHTHDYLLRALVSCGACLYSCGGRWMPPDYAYYVCRAKAQPQRSLRNERCPTRYIPAEALDALVWADLCELLAHPDSIAYALERAHGGHWLPQDLQARREQLRRGQAHLEGQIERLTQAYLAAVIALPEYQRRRQDLEQKIRALVTQAQQLDAQVDHQAELAGLATAITAFCQRVQAGLTHATFEQKRTLVELLIDRVVVTNDEVEIRYVIPTSPAGEHTRFCHLRKDYIDQGRQPVRHIQRGGFTRQPVIAQRPQHDRQVAEQSFRGGVLLARAVAANSRNQGVGGGALGIEVVEGQAMGGRIGGIGHERIGSSSRSGGGGRNGERPLAVSPRRPMPTRRHLSSLFQRDTALVLL
jgi:site-specific DNA recombinase